MLGLFCLLVETEAFKDVSTGFIDGKPVVCYFILSLYFFILYYHGRYLSEFCKFTPANSLLLPAATALHRITLGCGSGQIPSLWHVWQCLCWLLPGSRPLLCLGWHILLQVLPNRCTCKEVRHPGGKFPLFRKAIIWGRGGSFIFFLFVPIQWK